MPFNDNKLWKPIAKQLRDIATLDKGRPRRKFWILGAGVAGLVASYELRRLGHDVEILESSARIGGRVLTVRFGSGQYGELGAMRIPASHDYTLHYVKELGLKLRRFVDVSDRGFYDIRNNVIRREDVLEKLLPAFNLSRRELSVVRQHGIGSLLVLIVERETKKLSVKERKDLFKGLINTKNLNFLDRTSVRAVLRKVRSSEANELLGTATSLESLWNRPLIKYVRDALSENAAGLYEIVGGMDLLPGTLASKSRNEIKLSSEVHRIENRLENGSNLLISRNGIRHELVVGDVLCTLPFGVLRRIDLLGLSKEKMEAIRNVSYVSATKILLHCERRFWEETYGIVGGRSVSDHINRQTYYPSDNAKAESQKNRIQSNAKSLRYAWGIHTGPEMTAPPPFNHSNFVGIRSNEVSRGPGVLLGSYCWGSDARRFSALSPIDQAKLCMSGISRFHPEIMQQVSDCSLMNWDQNRNSMGAYADLLPLDLTTYYQNAKRREGRIHFAGEHLSPFPGWIQGGIYSALEAVKEMLGT